MLVGPSAIGKSTLMEEVARQNSSFAYVRSFTTRSPRPNEQGHYVFIDKKSARQLKQNGEAITYFEHPTTHDIYGTTNESYPAKFNLLDTLSGSVEMYRSLPFRETITVAITAPASDWQNWFMSRYPEPSAEAKKRLEEATTSINWALGDPKVHWVINTKDTIKKSAEKITSISSQSSPANKPPEHPYAMLSLIKEGIWHKK